MSKRQINYDNDKELTAQRLKEAMDDMGITLSELADKSKISKSSISQYTHATKSPSNISASAMAKVLGVNPVWLMGFDAPKSREEFKKSQDKRLAAYVNYTYPHLFLARIYDNLPIEGKKELRAFAEYLQNKYMKGGENEREHNTEEE